LVEALHSSSRASSVCFQIQHSIYSIMTEYTLHYFDSRGLAEPIRLILAYGQANWKDVRIPVTDPPTPIPDDIKARSPFGQVPILEVDGQVLAQSATITRYLARKFKLTGKDEWEAAKCDEIGDAIKDFIQLWSPLWREKDEEKRKQQIAEAVISSKERFVSKFNQMVEANGGKHIVGNSLTWADIIVAHFLENLARIAKVQLVDEAPALQALIDTVRETPHIKEYIATRAETKF